VKILRKYVSIKLNEEGTITVSVRAKTPFFSSKRQEDEARELSRATAAFFIEELDRVNKSLKTERARNTRIFLENRYRQNITDLQHVEEEFKAFQQRNGVIALPEQTTVLVSAMAELRAQIIAKEIEANILQSNLGDSHAEIVRVRSELRELRNKYAEFISKKQSRSAHLPLADDLFLAFSELPNVGLQYARLLREVLLQEKIQEFLLPQYEEAKIQEAKDTPTVQTLDPANKPIAKSKPRRISMVIIAGFSSILLSIFVLLLHENILILKETDRQKYERIIEMIGYTRHSWKFLKKKR
jgi:uncharacterized protein involved in exopolysaccharide biosynthesis